MPPRPVIVVNANARGARRDPGLPARLARIAGARAEVCVPDADALPALARALCDEGVELVALCGGDGTGQATLTELVRACAARARPLPRIALLRGGTVNTVARNLGIVGAPERLLGRLCARLDDGAPLPHVRQGLLTVEGRVGFLFAAALGARFLQLYYEASDPGPVRAALLAARVASSALFGGPLTARLFRPASLRLRWDDAAPRTLEARLLVATTVPDVGVGMRICPRAGDFPARFQLIASGLAPSAMARQLPAVLAGRALEGTPHEDHLCARASIELDADEPYTLDGELFVARRLTIEHAGEVSIVRP